MLEEAKCKNCSGPIVPEGGLLRCEYCKTAYFPPVTSRMESNPERVRPSTSTTTTLREWKRWEMSHSTWSTMSSRLEDYEDAAVRRAIALTWHGPGVPSSDEGLAFREVKHLHPGRAANDWDEAFRLALIQVACLIGAVAGGVCLVILLIDLVRFLL